MDGGAWYEPLLAPVRPTVQAALRDVSDVFEGDPWSVPRTGLGGALALQVARGFGRAGSRRARRLCASSIEAWNQRVHRPRRDELDRALARDTRDFLRAWSRFVREDDARAQRVVARLSPAWSAEAPVPEAVIFLRAAIAAGVLLGEVGDEVHAQLDAFATWTALAWEARQGTLDRARWEGALDAIGARAPFTADAESHARREAHAALAPWADHRTASALRALLDRLPSGPAAPREPDAWLPAIAPDPAPSRPARRGESALDRFIDAHARNVEDAIATIAEGAPARTRGAIEYLRRQGGKRLRPFVVLASTRACGGDPEWALREGAIVEWLHQTSLVIDDVLDGATLRRGGPTLHHATSVPFATAVALQLLARLAMAARDLPGESRVLVADTAAALAEGEWSEMRHSGDPTISITAYCRVIEAKTARLFATACALGGLAARATPASIRALTRAGREAGLAFQIVDDLLDAIGDEAELGKRRGTDLRARKPTLPTLLLRDALPPIERARLESLIRGDRACTDVEVAWAARRIEELEVDERCRERADAHLSRALAELARLPDREGAALLEGLFTRCVERRA
ncbi:polyprenyl synthetase family protein [Sandaracinus amylolyticus]|uniref:polyprenyl synthetase family protein n=1 Tax=Sandaracinus amylolyticus TaxID=927083 RepID=UPI001F17A13D|nr:polyprenyl synthetase family protein [Sandaracinus amylolyticus]UJR83368.1 Hypothetical protein I5071_54360 [Sandaracinus amylolyticus]